MMHRLKQGECLSSIAAAHGHVWKHVWKHPENAPLRDKRKDPNILLPGDVVFVPDREPKSVEVASSKKHRFTVKLDKVALHLRLTGNLEPLKSEPYVLQLEGGDIKGETDGDGKLDAQIPAGLTQVTLILPKRRQSYTLALGHLDPVDTPSGAEARLQNLRMLPDGQSNDATLKSALSTFQRVKKLKESGELDASTKAALRDEHGC
ncbi:MAG: hypothetical protein ABI134_19250 [Byssovorax sp.]